MRKAFVYVTEVWDYKDKEEFIEHYKTKYSKGFRVVSEYVSEQGYTVFYEKQTKGGI